jgi:hypothetical protein
MFCTRPKKHPKVSKNKHKSATFRTKGRFSTISKQSDNTVQDGSKLPISHNNTLINSSNHTQSLSNTPSSGLKDDQNTKNKIINQNKIKYPLPAVKRSKSFVNLIILSSHRQTQTEKYLSHLKSLRLPNASHRLELPYTHPVPVKLNRFTEQQRNLSKLPRINPKNQSDEVLINNLITWLQDNGAMIDDRVEVRSNDGELGGIGEDGNDNTHKSGTWGMFSTGKIPAGTIIASIPYPLCIQQLTQYDSITKFTNYDRDKHVQRIMEEQKQIEIDDVDNNDSTIEQTLNSIPNPYYRSKSKFGIFPKPNSQIENTFGKHFLTKSVFDKISKHQFGVEMLLFLHLYDVENSPLLPFLQTLPKAYPLNILSQFLQHNPNITALHPITKIDMQLTHGMGEMLKNYEQIRTFFSLNLPNLPKNKNRSFDFHSYHLITSILLSRSIIRQCLFDDQASLGRPVLIPLVDFIKKSHFPNSSLGFSTLGSERIHPHGSKPRRGKGVGLGDVGKGNTVGKDYITQETCEDLVNIVALHDIEEGEEIQLGFQQSSGKLATIFDPLIPFLKGMDEENVDKKEVILNLKKLQQLKSVQNVENLDDKDDRLKNLEEIKEIETFFLNRRLELVKNFQKRHIDPTNIHLLEELSPLTRYKIPKTVPTPPNKDGNEMVVHFERNTETKNENHNENNENNNKPEDNQTKHNESKPDENQSDGNTQTNQTTPKENSPETPLAPKYPYNLPFHPQTRVPPALLGRLNQLPSMNPLSETSIRNILSTGLSLYPQYDIDDLSPSSNNLPFQHIYMALGHGAFTHGMHLPFMISINKKKFNNTMTNQINIKNNQNDQVNLNQLTYMPFSISPTFLSSQINLEQILLSSAFFYDKALQHLGLFDLLIHPSYQSYLQRISDKHDYLEQNVNKIDIFDQLTAISSIKLPYNTAPLPFNTQLRPNVKSLQLALFAAEKVTVESMRFYKQFGKNDKTKTSQIGQNNPDLMDSADSSTALPSELSSYLSTESAIISDSQLYSKATAMSLDTPIGAPPLRNPRPTLAPLDEWDALNIQHPWRFGFCEISPQLELFCYLLASYSVSFDKVNLNSALLLKTIAKEVFDGGDDDDDDDGGGVNSKLDFAFGGDPAQREIGIKMMLAKTNVEGLGNLFGLFKKKNLDQNGEIEIANKNEEDGKPEENNESNDAEKSRQGSSTIDVQKKGIKDKLDNITKQDDQDPFAQLHLPAYAILLGILDTLISTQNPSIDFLSKSGKKRAVGIETGINADKSIHSITTNPPELMPKSSLPPSPFDLSPEQSHLVKKLTDEHIKLFQNVPNHAIQHIFNTISTKIGLKNQYWDLDSIYEQPQGTIDLSDGSSSIQNDSNKDPIVGKPEVKLTDDTNLVKIRSDFVNHFVKNGFFKLEDVILDLNGSNNEKNDPKKLENNFVFVPTEKFASETSHNSTQPRKLGQRGQYSPVSWITGGLINNITPIDETLYK